MSIVSALPLMALNAKAFASQIVATDDNPHPEIVYLQEVCTLNFPFWDGPIAGSLLGGSLEGDHGFKLGFAGVGHTGSACHTAHRIHHGDRFGRGSRLGGD